MSEQRIELKQARASRVGRNKTDMDILRTFCESRHFLQMNSMSNIDDGKLRNIASGLVAPANVNITDVHKCGESVLSKMEGTSPLTFI